jgi:GT2 family glycosyltransferase
MNEGLVSVVIPSYGRPDKLKNCLESVYRSTYDKIEVIIVDDPYNGTYATDFFKDNLSKIVKNTTEKFVAGCRNIGFKMSRGEFIFFLDSDNVIEEFTISEMVNIMRLRNDIGIIAPVAYYFFDKSRIWKNGEYKSKVLRLNKSYNPNKLQGKLFEIESMANAFLVRRKVMEDIGIFDNLNFPRDESEPDFYLRVRKSGLKTVMTMDSVTYHDIEIGRLAHFDPNRIKESFKSRIWLDRKHHYENIDFIGFYLTFLVPYYSFLVLINYKYRPLFCDLIKHMITGLYEGLFKNPATFSKSDHYE